MMPKNSQEKIEKAENLSKLVVKWLEHHNI